MSAAMNRSVTGAYLSSLSTMTTPSKRPAQTNQISQSQTPPASCSAPAISIASTPSQSLPPSSGARPSLVSPATSSCWQIQPPQNQDLLRLANNHHRNQHLPSNQPSQQPRLQHPPPPTMPLNQRRNHDTRPIVASSSLMKSAVGGSGCATKIEMTQASSSTSVNCFRCRGRRAAGGGCCSENADEVDEDADDYCVDGDKVGMDDFIDDDVVEWVTLDDLRQLDVHGLRQLLLRTRSTRRRWKSDNGNIVRRSRLCRQHHRTSRCSKRSCCTFVRQ